MLRDFEVHNDISNCTFCHFFLIFVAHSRSSAPRFGKHLPQFLPLVIKNVNVDDDELRENCLQASLFRLFVYIYSDLRTKLIRSYVIGS